MRIRAWIAACGVLVLATACGDGPTRPSSGGAFVTFDVAGERFRVWLTESEDVEAAERAQAGGPARIPNGRIVAGTQFNTGWSWHLEDVEFTDIAIELCDGRPSDVEWAGTGYGGGRFCPWGARIVAIETF